MFGPKGTTTGHTYSSVPLQECEPKYMCQIQPIGFQFAASGVSWKEPQGTQKHPGVVVKYFKWMNVHPFRPSSKSFSRPSLHIYETPSQNYTELRRDCTSLGLPIYLFIFFQIVLFKIYLKGLNSQVISLDHHWADTSSSGSHSFLGFFKD